MDPINSFRRPRGTRAMLMISDSMYCLSDPKDATKTAGKIWVKINSTKTIMSYREAPKEYNYAIVLDNTLLDDHLRFHKPGKNDTDGDCMYFTVWVLCTCA